MKLQIYKTLWGHIGSLSDAILACREQDLAGLEAQAPSLPGHRLELRAKLADAGLSYIAEICTAGGYVPRRQASPSEHLESLRRLAEAAVECNPLFVTVIAGCDAWTVGQNLDFFGKAIEIASDFPIPLSFETHRSRSLFNPWIARDILMQLPALKLTCDFSHWCVVCERFIDTEPEILALCASRAHHVHARVGYDQGPQVPDPAAPEYAEALSAHERWWSQIWHSQLARGISVSTMTPEFGPDGYLHTLPFTQAPVADLSQINIWMGERQKHRFREFMSALTRNQQEPCQK